MVMNIQLNMFTTQSKYRRSTHSIKSRNVHLRLTMVMTGDDDDDNDYWLWWHYKRTSFSVCTKT